MEPNPQFSIEFQLSDDPLEWCDCNGITFSDGKKRTPLKAKRYPKEKGDGKFPWDKGAVAFTILMLRLKLEYTRGAGSYELQPAKRGTIEASAYDVIEKANWLPRGFGYQSTTGDEHRVFRLKQLTTAKRKRVSIQVDTNLLSPKAVCFYRGKSSRSLRQAELRTLETSLISFWKKGRHLSKNRGLEQARKIVARRLSESGNRKTGQIEDGVYSPPPNVVPWPTVAKAFPAASINRKIAIVKEELIPLLEECARLTKRENPDVHLRLLTMIAGLHYQEHHLKEALSYAKRAASLGQELDDPYAAQLGRAVTEDLQKRLAPEESGKANA
jgi:hypothetical protein